MKADDTAGRPRLVVTVPTGQSLTAAAAVIAAVPGAHVQFASETDR